MAHVAVAAARVHQVAPEYTVANTVSARVPDPPRPTFASANWQAFARNLPDPEHLSARDTGESVVEHRSSRVRRVAAGDTSVFVKTYDYLSWRDRAGNWGKWTAPWRPSRARRECAAFGWFARNGFAAPAAYACFEWRTAGWLRRAVLVTAALPGLAADQKLAQSAEPARVELAERIGRLVRALHDAGFRDRNLDLRNLIVADDRIAKIDSPRHRIVPPGRRDDRLARADWQRLAPQLARFGVDAVARRAADD